MCTCYMYVCTQIHACRTHPSFTPIARPPQHFSAFFIIFRSAKKTFRDPVGKRSWASYADRRTTTARPPQAAELPRCVSTMTRRASPLRVPMVDRRWQTYKESYLYDSMWDRQVGQEPVGNDWQKCLIRIRWVWALRAKRAPTVEPCTRSVPLHRTHVRKAHHSAHM